MVALEEGEEEEEEEEGGGGGRRRKRRERRRERRRKRRRKEEEEEEREEKRMCGGNKCQRVHPTVPHNRRTFCQLTVALRSHILMVQSWLPLTAKEPLSLRNKITRGDSRSTTDCGLCQPGEGYCSHCMGMACSYGNTVQVLCGRVQFPYAYGGIF